MHKGHLAIGTVEGTGSAINLQLGFTPKHVRLVNEDGLAAMEWFAGMADGHGIKTVTAGTMSKVTTNGVTPYAGTPGGDAEGITIGADTDINVSGETLHYVAVSPDS